MSQIKNFKNNIVCMGITVIIVIICLFLVYRLWSVNLAEIPLASRDDGVWELASHKMVTEGKKMSYTSERLGAPFGYEAKDFTAASFLPKLWMNLWALLTDNYILGFNLGYLFAYILLAIVALFVLLKLGVRAEVSIVAAVLYSFLPYHILRGQVHFALSFYIVVPVSVYYILKLMGNEKYSINRKSIGLWIIAMILSGMDGIYYAFFSCFFLCVAIFYNVLNKAPWKKIIGCIFSIGLICIGVLLSVIPNLIYWYENGINRSAVGRQSSEVTFYALRLAQLILPVTNHRIEFLERIKAAYNRVIIITESDWATLGLCFTVGFILLLIHVFRAHNEKEESIFTKLSVLTYCGLAYATIGGFIEIQAVIFSLIRCANRISVFIAFFACISFSIVVEKALSYFKGQKSYVIYIVLFLILCIGIYDQTPKNDSECYSTFYDSDTKAFVAEIEATDPEAMILQLPNVSFPENGIVNEMKDYAHFVGYLYSDKLRWSYGAMKGREGSVLLNNLCSLSTEEMVKQAAEIGFDGIYIDRYGYKSDEAEILESTIYEITKQEPIVSANNRYVYFSLGQYIINNNISFNQKTLSENLIIIVNGDGMYNKETNDKYEWYWCQNDSSIIIANYSNEELTVGMSFEIEVYGNQNGTINISCGDSNETIYIDGNNQKQTFNKDFYVLPGENEIVFTSDMQNISIENGQRQICFRIINEDISVEY